MQEENKKKYSSYEYDCIIEKKHKLDNELMEEKHPDVFFAGLTYKFSEAKAKKRYPVNVIETAIQQCSKGGTEYVKIRPKSKRRKKKTT